MMQLLGKKKGMTQIFDEAGNRVPVTVIEAGPCVVTQKKSLASKEYDAIQLAFEKVPDKRVRYQTKAAVGHFKKAKLEPYRILREFRTDSAAYELGQTLTVSLFQKGDLLDVVGTSKGKGFQGVIKRHHKAGGPASHGSRFHRSTGSIGQRAFPGEVFKNMKLPGHMGDEKTTMKNIEVVQVLPEDNVLLVKGAVPGAKEGLLILKNKTAQVAERLKVNETK